MGSVISHTLVGIVSAVVMFALVGALCWYGVPRIWAYGVTAEFALRELPVVQKQLADLKDADLAAANAAQKQCDARVLSTIKAAGTIRRLAAPQVRAANGAQPTLNAADIRDLIAP